MTLICLLYMPLVIFFILQKVSLDSRPQLCVAAPPTLRGSAPNSAYLNEETPLSLRICAPNSAWTAAKLLNRKGSGRRKSAPNSACNALTFPVTYRLESFNSFGFGGTKSRSGSDG
jgi:hypothetical protein